MSNRQRYHAARNNNLDYSDSDRTDFTPYSQGQGSYYYDLDGSDRTPYSYYPEFEGAGNTLDGSDRTPYSYYDSQGQQSYYDSFDNGRTSTTHSGRQGTYHSGYYEDQTSDMYSVQSYVARDNMSQASNYSRRSQQSYRTQNGSNASVCGSTTATTVANGGRGRCPYQIGFNVQNAGKQMSTTKRIIHFRFGFANAQALSMGRAGVDCRGEEHDLCVTWSITGGKRLISLDGREIQYSAGKRANTSRRADILECAWKMSDHIFELKCYAYKPKSGSPEKRNPKFHQYNLTIDGRSFFELPEIFDLGLKGLGTRNYPSMTISGSSVLDHTTSSTITGASSSRSASTQYTTDQSSVKSSIQSRIDEQRRLMKQKKQGSTTKKKIRSVSDSVNSGVTFDSASDATSSNLMSFRSLNVSENQHEEESEIYSSGVFSSAPSELNEARNRQYADNASMSSTSTKQQQQQQRAPSPKDSSLVPKQRQAQQSGRYPSKPKYLSPVTETPTTNIVADRVQRPESSTNIVTGRAPNLYPSQQMNIPEPPRMTLAPQQPPTYEEITQALVPTASSVPSKGEMKVDSRQVSHQPKALPPPESQPKAVREPKSVPPASVPQHQDQPTLPKGINKFAFF